jgi:Domain of unknown function (DUF4279)
MLISVQLFVQGDHLQPDAITTLVGVEPQVANALGDTWTSPTGKIYVKKVGLWKWGVSEDAQGADLSTLVVRFCEKLKHAAKVVLQLPAAERTWIDVFVCHEPEKDASAEVEFSLSPVALRALCSFELPIEFTTSVVVNGAARSTNEPPDNGSG